MTGSELFVQESVYELHLGELESLCFSAIDLYIENDLGLSCFFKAYASICISVVTAYAFTLWHQGFNFMKL